MTAFAFGIPLRPRSTSKNWQATVTLFRNTLRSILQQTDTEFRVFVCCHEIPNTAELLDSRVEVIEAHWGAQVDAPKFDKRSKLVTIAQAWHRAGGGYLMLVDANDLVSRNLVSCVRRHRPGRGFYVERGYEYDMRRGLIRLAPRFHRLCASSLIINWSPTELPRDDIPPVEDCLYRHVVDIGHARIADFFAADGEPLTCLPFPAAVFIRNHGDNASAITGIDGWRRKMLRRISPKHPPGDDLYFEFGLPQTGRDTLPPAWAPRGRLARSDALRYLKEARAAPRIPALAGDPSRRPS